MVETCFVLWRLGVRVSKNRRRSFSAAPLSRGFRNVTWQDVFRYGLFTLAQRQYKYKLFPSHNAHKYLFCSVSLVRVAEWSRVEWSRLEWSRGHWRRGSETLRKPGFCSFWAKFILNTNEIWALLRRGFNCYFKFICEAWETLQNKAFVKQILKQFWTSRGGAINV